MVTNLSYPVLIPPHVKSLTRKGVLTLVRLLRHLSPYRRHPIGRDELIRLAERSSCFITAVRDPLNQGGHMIGLIRLEVRQCSDGQRYGELHDEIVGEHFRHNGVGRALVERAIEQARRLKAVRIDLKVKPHRKEAIQHYQSLGFVLISAADPSIEGSTNHYQLAL